MGLKITILAGPLVTSLLGAALAQAPQAPQRLAPCPPPTDTLSLLHPSDSAYADAPAVSRFLAQAGFRVRCITRSMASGLMGIGRVAGFQTDRGTITVLFLPATEQVHVTETRMSGGYRYSFQRSARAPAVTTLNSDGRIYYMARGDWFIEVFDSTLADQLQRLIAAGH